VRPADAVSVYVGGDEMNRQPRVEVLKRGTGFSSMDAPDDTLIEYMQLKVNGEDVLVQHEAGNNENVLVGIGGPLGTLEIVAIDELDEYIRSRT